MLRFQSQRIRGQGILLQCVDIGGHTLGNSINQRNANNANRTGKGGQHGSALFTE